MALIGWAMLKPVQQALETLAVLGQVDGVGRGAEDRHAGLLQRVRQLQRRLAAELHDHADQLALRGFDLDQLQHVLGGQRLEVEPVGGVVVGGDGLGVAVDHDRLDADLVEREGRVAAAVVELDALADAVRAAAEDDRLLAIARLGLALGRLAERAALVGRVHVGRRRRELGRAGVDALEHRPHAQRAARGATLPPRSGRSARPAARRRSPAPSAAAAPRRRPAGRGRAARASSATSGSIWRRNQGS